MKAFAKFLPPAGPSTIISSDPDAPGKMSTRMGGFLDQIDRFDPAFFGIAPREAVAMGIRSSGFSWRSGEAVENAGLAPRQA